MKKALIILSVLSAINNASALICPTAHQIQNGNFLGFTPIDIDNDEPTSPAMNRYFQQHVESFWMAEWMQGTLYPSHCYYRLNDKQGWSQVYLGYKQDKQPNGKYWAGGSTMKQCKKSTMDCQF